jgi:hypothetical protein
MGGFNAMERLNSINVIIIMGVIINIEIIDTIAVIHPFLISYYRSGKRRAPTESHAIAELINHK